MGRLTAFWKCDRGATSIEYCLIATIVSLSLIAGARIIGVTLNAKMLPIATALS